MQQPAAAEETKKRYQIIFQLFLSPPKQNRLFVALGIELSTRIERESIHRYQGLTQLSQRIQSSPSNMCISGDIWDCCVVGWRPTRDKREQTNANEKVLFARRDALKEDVEGFRVEFGLVVSNGDPERVKFKSKGSARTIQLNFNYRFV